MIRFCRRSRWSVAAIVAAAIAAGCAAPGGGSLGTSAGSHRARMSGAGPYPGAATLALLSKQGLAEFSSADGRLVRWLVVSASGEMPVVVSPNGRWVYYNNLPVGGACAGNGFTEPVLWRVSVRGGPPRRTGIRTTSIAFSPDGRMMAYTSTRHCGRTVWLVVVNRRTGQMRRVLLARNQPMSNNPVFMAELSWAPDDMHLAVATEPAAAINVLSVINAWQATDARREAAIPACAGDLVGCFDPGFDIHGRLTFVKWREPRSGSGFAEWVMRWQDGRATPLFRLTRDQALSPPHIAVSRTGNAVLLASMGQHPGIWRWSGGSPVLIHRSTRHFLVTSPLWLRRDFVAAVGSDQ